MTDNTAAFLTGHEGGNDDNPRDATFADRVLFLVDGELAPEVQLTGPDIPVEQVNEALVALSI